MHRLFLTLSLIGLGSGANAADDVASDYWVRVMPAAWFVAFDGDAQYTADGTTGDNLSLSDADLDNTEIGMGLELSAKLPILFSFHAGFFAAGTDASFISPGVDFGGSTFTGAVESTVDLTDIYVEADLQLLDLDLVGCAIGLGYHLVVADLAIRGSSNSETLDEAVQFPVIALRAHANLPMLTSLGAEAKIHWMEASYNDTSVGYIDASIQITWRPWEMLGFIGGYRHVAVDLGLDSPDGVNSDADVDLTLSGPFLGLTAQF